VSLGGSRSLSAAVDVFNALGADNLVTGPQAQSFLENPEVGRPDTQEGDPRNVQISLRVRF